MKLQKSYHHFFSLLSLLVFVACQPAEEKLFELVTPNHSGIHFSNTIWESDSVHYFNFPYIYTGAGVGIADFDQDGLPDIFFSGNMVSSRLYLNKGNFVFDDVSQTAGITTKQWATGVSIVDINQDGWPDIYLCVGGPGQQLERKNLLFLNNQDLTFTESAADYGLADEGHSTQAAFFDYDRDGDLDAYVMTHANEPYAAISKLSTKRDGTGPSTDRLYENIGSDSLGHPYFRNVSKSAGIQTEGYGLGLAISDLNLDGWPDIYVANDFIANDLLYINNQDGSFSNQMANYTQHSSKNGMGLDIADLNNDALPDILVMDMLPQSNQRQKTMTANMNYDYFKRTLQQGFSAQFIKNSLQVHQGIGLDGSPNFSEVGRLTGLHQTDWSWAPLIADFDQDGWQDVFITNGFRRDVTDHDFQEYSNQSQVYEKGSGQLSIPNVLEQLLQLDSVNLPNYLFQNKGQLQFADQTLAWGMGQHSMSNGSAYADFDQDGDLDLVISNLNAPAFLYENKVEEFTPKHLIQVKLTGPIPNRDGIGARLIAQLPDGSRRRFEHYPVRGYLSSSEAGIQIGLGDFDQIDTLEVLWPNGVRNFHYHLKADTTYHLGYNDQHEALPNRISSEVLFQEVADQLNIHHQHEENSHSDFRLEPLLLHLNDHYGPGIAVGDINGDHRDDFYIGGARDQAGQLFFQKPDGRFDRLALENSAMFEDMGALFFDADQDEDLDLYVVSGGSSIKYFNKGHYQDRLYLNDGNGNFQLDLQALPQIQSSGSCVIATDFDQDNDLDLFVGGRLVPGKFPQSPRSYLLENQGGKFRDVTEDLAPGLDQIGMISAALWTDFDNDQDLDLMLAGEWMPITLFENTGGQLKNITQDTDLTEYSGWWNSLIGADFDHDGDIDYVAGNLGMNSAYKVSKSEPLRVYANDFDKNSVVDAIITKYIQGRAYPVAPRGALINQVELVKRAFPNYSQFADADIHQILTAFDTTGMSILEANYLQSSYIENVGNGKFAVHPLPIEAQFAPLFGLEIGDFNEDGHLDIMGIGNFYATEVITGWYDALKGIALFGNGQGDFESRSGVKTGFLVDGDARALASLASIDGSILNLVSVNADHIKVFQKNTTYAGQFFKLRPNEIWAELEDKNGRKTKIEFYQGQGYLSQSTPILQILKNTRSVLVFDQHRNSRTIPGFDNF